MSRTQRMHFLPDELGESYYAEKQSVYTTALANCAS